MKIYKMFLPYYRLWWCSITLKHVQRQWSTVVNRLVSTVGMCLLHMCFLKQFYRINRKNITLGKVLHRASSWRGASLRYGGFIHHSSMEESHGTGFWREGTISSVPSSHTRSQKTTNQSIQYYKKAEFHESEVDLQWRSFFSVFFFVSVWLFGNFLLWLISHSHGFAKTGLRYRIYA